ncbi:MAG: hypothetical protein CM15mP62_20460 [Rhodospirillaceae bacterium]|nr:MAG: hypothetical protein CM15mP62_20460 [Rhodospirillaceae bacterium]
MSPYASGLACLVEDEMDLGATVVDMGGGRQLSQYFLMVTLCLLIAFRLEVNT